MKQNLTVSEIKARKEAFLDRHYARYEALREEAKERMRFVDWDSAEREELQDESMHALRQMNRIHELREELELNPTMKLVL